MGHIANPSGGGTIPISAALSAVQSGGTSTSEEKPYTGPRWWEFFYGYYWGSEWKRGRQLDQQYRDFVTIQSLSHGNYTPEAYVANLKAGMDSAKADLKTVATANVIFVSVAAGAASASLATEPSTTVFWSGRTNGVGGADVAADIATAQKGTTLEQLTASRGINLPVWDASNPASIAAWENASRAFAQGASGRVTVVLGRTLRPGSVWETVELPALEANPNVTEIVAVDPATGATTIIFKR